MMRMSLSRCLKPFKRLAGSTGAAAISLAVAGGSIYALGFAGPEFFSVPNPLTFDAPTWRKTAHESGQREMSRALAKPETTRSGDVTIADDWTYTAITRGLPQPSP